MRVTNLTLCLNMFYDVIVKTMPHISLKNVYFLKSVPEFENPENVPMLIVLDDMLD